MKNSESQFTQKELSIGAICKFKVVEVKESFVIIQDIFGQTHKYNKLLPLQKVVFLKIKSKENNKYQFEPTYRGVNFSEGQIIKLQYVKTVMQKTANELYEAYLVLKDVHGNELKVKAFNWQTLSGYQPPSTINCKIKRILLDDLLLEQEIDETIRHPHYEIKKQYEFEVHNVEKRVDKYGAIDEIIIMIGKDGLYYYTKLLFGQNKEQIIGTTIKCEFNGFYKNGDLRFYQSQRPFVSFDDLVKYTNPAENLRIDKFNPNIFLESDETAAYKMLNDYSSSNNLWIFSYLQMLNILSTQKLLNFDYLGAKNIYNFCIKIENWIISSGFLKNFSEDNRGSNIDKAKHSIIEYERLLKVIDILEDMSKPVQYLHGKMNEDKISEEDLRIMFDIIMFSPSEIVDNHILFDFIKKIADCDEKNIKKYKTEIIKLIVKRKKDLREKIYPIKKTMEEQDLLILQNIPRLNELLKLTLLEARLYYSYDNIIRSQSALANYIRMSSYIIKEKPLKMKYLNFGIMQLNCNECSVFAQNEFEWKNLRSENIDKYITKIIYEENKSLDIWDEIKEANNNQFILEVDYLYENAMSILINYKGFRGIMLKSHLLQYEALACCKGNKIKVIPILCDEYNKTFIVTPFRDDNKNSVMLYKDRDIDSILAGYWTEDEMEEYKQKYRKSIKLGSNYPGKIKRLEDYGAFVDLGGFDGLVHRSELAWQKIENPSTILKVGQVLDFRVIGIDESKVQLSLKNPADDPWLKEDKIPVKDELCIVKITKIITFGVMVELNSGLSGLIHRSNIPQPIKAWNKIYRVGNYLSVKVEDVDKVNRRLSFKNPSNIYEYDASKLQIAFQSLFNTDHDYLLKEYYYEAAFTYEYLALCSSEINDKIHCFELSYLFYVISQSSRQFLLFAYINYFKTVIAFEKNDTKLLSDCYIRFEEEKMESSLELFPSVRNLKTIVDILLLFNDCSFETLEKLFNIISQNKNLNNQELKLAKLVLANNLVGSEQYDKEHNEKNKLRIIKFIKEGIIMLSEIELNENIAAELELKNRIAVIKKQIDAGESDMMEFKQTLRINIQSNQIDKKIEFEVVKTISAFLNTNGGVLYIGVSDRKDILGIKQDLDSFNVMDKIDAFRKHYDNLIGNYIGNQFCTHIDLEIIKVDHCDICRICVKRKSEEPVFLKTQDQEFYVRRQGSSSRLKGKELWDYLQSNFNRTN